jgi:hypothetical protein
MSQGPHQLIGGLKKISRQQDVYNNKEYDRIIMTVIGC